MARENGKASTGKPPSDNGTVEPIGTVEPSTGNDNGNGTGSGITADNGTGNNSTSGSADFEFRNNTEPTEKRKRGRPKGSSNTEAKTASTKTSKKKEVDSDKAAKFLMQRLTKLSSMILDKDTSFNEEETFLIEPSLSSILEDMNFDAVEKYSKIINPLVLLFGLGMWYIRIAPKSTIQKIATHDNQTSPVHETNVNEHVNDTETRNDNPFVTTYQH